MDRSMAMISYAQNGEDVMLMRALKSVQNGFYIDAGACDPTLDSVTRAFYELGWHGVNVEPSPEHYAALTKERPRDVSLQVILGDIAGERDFSIIAQTGLSTALPDLAKRHQAAGWNIETVRLPATTLASVCQIYAPSEIHFLKIDVEGSEKSVIKGMDFNVHRPWIIVVEATIPLSTEEDYADWEPLIEEAGYCFVWFDGLNRFYLALEKVDELRPHFRVQPNVFDGYQRYDPAASEQQARSRAEAEALAQQLAEAQDSTRETAVVAEEARARGEAAERRAGAAEEQASLLHRRMEAADVNVAAAQRNARVAQRHAETLAVFADATQATLRALEAQLLELRNHDWEARRRADAAQEREEAVRSLLAAREAENDARKRLQQNELEVLIAEIGRRSTEDTDLRRRVAELESMLRDVSQPFPLEVVAVAESPAVAKSPAVLAIDGLAPAMPVARPFHRRLMFRLYQMVLRPVARPLAWRTRSFLLGGVERQIDDLLTQLLAATGQVSCRQAETFEQLRMRGDKSVDMLHEVVETQHLLQARQQENFIELRTRADKVVDIGHGLERDASRLSHAPAVAGTLAQALPVSQPSHEPPLLSSSFEYSRWIIENEMAAATAPKVQPLPDLSILLSPQQDEGIMATLASIAEQSVRCEVVLADSMASPYGAHKLDLVRVDAGATLDALFARAGGDYVLVLEPGDLLTSDALVRMLSLLAKYPETDILYADEDRLDARGLRINPQFKPGWSPELMEAFNYLGRPTILRRSLLERAGGFGDAGAGTEWAANLRVCSLTTNIRRLPAVLCHRSASGMRERSNPDSAAAADKREALRLHLAVQGITAKVTTRSDGTQHATWKLAALPLVSVVVPSRNRRYLLQRCLTGLLEGTDYPNLEVVVVDNGSNEADVLAYYDELGREDRVRIVPFNQPFNYSAACNHGAAQATGSLLLFLNNDIEVLTPGWLEELVRVALRPGVGIVGTKLVFPDGTLQHAGVVVGMHLCGLVFRGAVEDEWSVFGSPEVPRNWLAIMGACQMVSRAVFDRVGGFDESYEIANSDVALCLAAHELGHRTAYVPGAALRHHEGATRGHTNPAADMCRTARDLRRMGVNDDPYFHPGLDAAQPVPTLRTGNQKTLVNNLHDDIVHYLGQPTSVIGLWLWDVAQLQTGCGLQREHLLWTPQAAERISDTTSATRWVLDLLRIRTDLRRRFPKALSEGEDGAFCRWLTGDEDPLHLDAARQHVLEAFRSRPDAPAKQLYAWRSDLRETFPLGLLPQERQGLFTWFIVNGTAEEGVPLEAIWWFFATLLEDRAGALVATYRITPAWQHAAPDGLTVFGRVGLATWLERTYGGSEAWSEPATWNSGLSAADEVRLALSTRGEWRKWHPRALLAPEAALSLLSWLAAPGAEGAGLDQEVRTWVAAQDHTALAASLCRVGVNVVGHFCYPSGLRTSTEAIVNGLRQNGVTVQARDIRTDRNDDPHHMDFLGFEIEDTTIIHTQPEPFFDTAYARSDLAPRTPRTYRIAYWYWELETVPDAWAAQAEQVDEIWAATRFVGDALRQRLDKPVHVMFPGVALARFTPRRLSEFGVPEDRYTFLFAFHMMSIMERKNPLGLIRAFRKAFTAQDNAQLILKTSFGSRHPDQLQSLNKAARDANIVIIDEVFSQSDTLALMNAADCYVSLHRSEGLGLTMAEAMLMGKPVIATGYSGNVDFMTDQNSMLVDYELQVLDRPVPPYEVGARWANPSEAHAATLMRQAFENQQWARDLGAIALESARDSLDLQASGRAMTSRLEAISESRVALLHATRSITST